MDSYFSRTNVTASAICFYALLGTIFFNRKSRSHQENTKMASSLSLLAPLSSLPRNWIHHVFPSFHGADVRTNFLSHVLKELRSKGINSFIDDDMERSKLVGLELIEAIRGSRIAIVLLSRNYASSTWCLNELVEIIKCRQEFSQTVIPLFYEVDPTDVKKQTGDFGKVFRKTCKGKAKEDIQRWKCALTEVAQITGYHSTNWKTEAKMIEDIATEVSNKLNLSAPSSDFDDLVGMESQMRRMKPLLQLDSDDVRIIGIWGSPGIGKTTIARSLFHEYSRDFQMSVFVDNIKRKYAVPACSDDYSVKLDFQKQFMSQLTNETCVSISHLGVVKDRLKDKKVLVVLDDVDHLVQLEAMAKETYWFGPGSRIIITTQDQRVLKASGINYIHRVKLPSKDEAFQMFCMYALGQKYPKDGFKELACEVINLVGYLPLGLRVMGAYFRGMSEKVWAEALPRLKAHLSRDKEITNILKFSYDALNDEDKSLFLHIACFFNLEPFGMVERCLETCFEDVRQGLDALYEKSLISSVSGRIKMSKLLVQLGRQIMRKEFVSEHGKRQFLNDARDIGEVLSDDKAGNSSVIGINLEWKNDITRTSERAFERLPNLQFLKIHGYGIKPQSMSYMSQKLRVLIWLSYPISCFPSSFNPEFLVELYMTNSNLEKFWEGIKPLNNLKLLDLSGSERLKELPDLSTATNLYELNLSSCSRLVELPSSMRNLHRLSRLELMNCSMLEVVLANINLESIEELDLSDCSLLKSYHESSTYIEELDPWRKSRLQKLVLSGMKKLVSLPQLPDSLLFLDAEECESLERLDCSFRNPDIRLNFRHCFKLNQEARDLIIQTPTNQYAVFPAEEFPQCFFTYRSPGSSVTAKLNQLHVGKSTKFKACIIFDGGDDSHWGPVCCCITSGGNALTYYTKNVEAFFLGHLYAFEIEVETEDVTSTELLFDFYIVYMPPYSSRKCKIKECGILQLLEVPLLSSRDVVEDYEPSHVEGFGYGSGEFEPSYIERFGYGSEDYEPSYIESSGDEDEDYEPSDSGYLTV
ncbi:probable disease resistance protein RPP1 isoform X3 [Brassica rapa]|nr:probable disease resistance protein RPP1 isoform X3 [Brassica rapa]